MDEMVELKLCCPHCGETLYFMINEAGDIALRSFDIFENSDSVCILKESGYEFGTATAEGGDK